MVQSATRASVRPLPVHHLIVPVAELRPAEYFAELFLVDLADARSRETVDEDDLVGNAEFRDDAAFGEDFEVLLDLGFADGRVDRRVPHHERHGPLAPFLV